MDIPLKGLRNLRTLSARADQLSVPYRAYMQITCLEMEKLRRGSERRSASRRILEIDHRLTEIEAEKTEILQALAERPAGPPKPARGRFKIRY